MSYTGGPEPPFQAIMQAVGRVTQTVLQSGMEIMREAMHPPVQEMRSVSSEVPMFYRGSAHSSSGPSGPSNIYDQSTRWPPASVDPFYSMNPVHPIHTNGIPSMMESLIRDTEDAITRMAEHRSMHYGNSPGSIPLDPDRLDGLPIVEDMPEMDWCCSVCLEAEAEANIRVRLACGHIFHRDCVTQWLREHSDCPVCRCDLNRGVPTPHAGSGTPHAGSGTPRRNPASERPLASEQPGVWGRNPASESRGTLLPLRIRLRDGNIIRGSYPDTSTIKDVLMQQGLNPQDTCLLFLTRRLDTTLTLAEAGVQEGDLLVVWNM